MEVEMRNTYAGEILNITLTHEHKNNIFTIISISGYLETNTQKIKYLGLPNTILNGNQLSVILDKNIIPSFKSKNFNVWYECVISLIFKDHVLVYNVPFILRNNNIQEYIFEHFINLKSIKNLNSNYYLIKGLITFLLHFKLFNKDKSKNIEEFIQKYREIRESSDSCFKELDNANINESDSITFKSEGPPFKVTDMDKIMKLKENSVQFLNNSESNCLPPSFLLENYKNNQNFEELIDKEIKYMENALCTPLFNDANVFLIKEKYFKKSIYAENDKIATISLPIYFIEGRNMKVKFFKDIKNLEIFIYKMQYENGNLIDINSVFNKKLNTENCVETNIELFAESSTIKTFIFEIKYRLNCYFDNHEISTDLIVIDRYSKVKFTTE